MYRIFSLIFMCLTLVYLPKIAGAAAPTSNLGEIFKQAFNRSAVVFLGETHPVAEHKVILENLLKFLIDNRVIDTFAFEFVATQNNSVLNQYLSDDLAIAGSEKEASYLAKLNREYVLFDSIEYDRVMRLLWRLHRARPDIKFCGIDYNKNYVDKTSAMAPFSSPLVAIQALPEKLKAYLLKISPTSDMSKIADMQTDQAREPWLAANTAACLLNSKKALVFAGRGHVVRSPTTSIHKQASDYFNILHPEKNALSAVMFIDFYDPLDSFSNALQQPDFLSISKFDAVSAFFTPNIPNAIKESLKIKTGQTQGTDILPLLDIWIFGPAGTKTILNPKYKWR